MAETPIRPLTRDVLSKFLPNQEAIRRFEELFQVAGDITPAQIIVLFARVQEVLIDANNAVTLGNQVEGQLQEFMDNNVLQNQVFARQSPVNFTAIANSINFSSAQNILANQVFGP